MGFDFSQVKAKARQVVHSTLAVSATYQDSTMVTPVPITARWLNKLSKVGDLENQGYGQMLESIDRVVLDVQVARSLGVKKGGTISFTSYLSEGATPEFILALKLPTDGPVNEVWEVTRKCP
jgi:hypothetical protein